MQWYLDNPGWVADVQSGAYREWVRKQYNQGNVAVPLSLIPAGDGRLGPALGRT